MLKIPKYQLYLLQLENYELWRYFRLLFKKGLWPKGEQRKDLVWTMKARVVFIFAVLLHFSLTFFVFWVLSNGLSVASIKYYVLSVLFFILLATCYMLLYIVAVLFLWPFDFIAKRFIIARAKGKIRKLDSGSEAGMTSKGLKIIGIAGSYGKTTMKQVLVQVLGIRYKVLGTPESVNTPVGIARWVLKKFGGNLEIAIVEMGEHYQGDVKDICDIAKPDIAVVTGINEAHLERMKKMEIITDTIFEIVSNAKPGAMVVLNGDDENIINNYKKYVWPDMRVAQYQVSPLRQGFGGQASIKYQVFDTAKLVWVAEFADIGRVEVNLLGEYALGDVSAAIIIAKSLGMSNEEIKKGIKKIKPVEHRLQPIKSAGNVLVIDDSYNGNPQGAAEAIKVLSRFSAKGGSAFGGENRRKIYITPGLVEMGKAAPNIHREIGKQLASVADVVILIRNNVTPYIEEGILSVSSRVQPPFDLAQGALNEVEWARDPLINYQQGIPRSDALPRNGRPEVVFFDTAQEAHAALSTILKQNDVILFQNDWGDQYI